MAKQVIAYAAEDGTRFDTEAEAAEHDLRARVLEIRTNLGDQGVEHFLVNNAEVILPLLKALVDGRVRSLNPTQQPSLPATAVSSPNLTLPAHQPPSTVKHKMPTPDEMRGLPQGGGVVRGAPTGWSVYQENGSWFCTNGSEKVGPFAKRGDAVAHFRSKESANRV